MSHPAMNSSNIEENTKIKSNLINDFITITENEEYNLNQTFNSPDVTNKSINKSFSPPIQINTISDPTLLSRGSQAVRKKNKFNAPPAPSTHQMTTRRKGSL